MENPNQLHAVKITEENPAFASLRRSWVTAQYTGVNGIGPMGSLHEAGDSIVAVARLGEEGTIIEGSGVMVGPGLVLTATHVLDEFPKAGGARPEFLTFLPDGARAWFPKHRNVLVGPSRYYENVEIKSDISLVSVKLHSDAMAHHPLKLAPLKVEFPLIGARLWAFGYRHGEIIDGSAQIEPLVTSGLVTAAYPHGRGERMPAACVEIATDAEGGMSGGPVVNEDGDVIGIVSSSIDGGTMYATLLFDVLRLSVSCTAPEHADRADIDLITARSLGLVKMKGDIRRRAGGRITVTMSDAEIQLMQASADPERVAQELEFASARFDTAWIESFEEKCGRELEDDASEAAMRHLGQLDLRAVREFLAASGIPDSCLNAIMRFSVSDCEGLEDPEIHWARTAEDGTIELLYSFDLMSVVWKLDVATSDYLAKAAEFDRYFLNAEANGSATTMQEIQQLYFEARFSFNAETDTLMDCGIATTAVKMRRC